MAFKQHCFIRKNTPKLRKKLEELGYTNGAWESPHFEYPYLMCFPNRKFSLFNVKTDGVYMTEDDYRCDGKTWTYNPPKEYIDCGDNEELFIALAALRDDTDEKQWFIMDYGFQKMWVFSETKQFDTNQPFIIKAYKATVEELIEHFKKE